MPREKKQLEITAFSPQKCNAEIYYTVDGKDEVFNVRALALSDIIELRRMFNAHKVIIENYE